MRKKLFIFSLVTLAFIGVAGVLVYNRVHAPASSSIPQTRLDRDQQSKITVVAENLDTPWSINVLPDNSLLVTERNGIARVIGSNNREFEVADVVEQGEGGLLGVELDPSYTSNNYLYVYKTIGPTNLVERYRFDGEKLTDRTDILTGIPAASNHNGGALRFGPDDKLYIATGDAGQENLAQDKNSLAGKILRVNADGSIPGDNPFGNAVWSYGHRNVQGLAWDDQSRLWATEHGPSGTQSGYDELNLITKGGNYGWPLIRGDQTRDGLISPIAQSGADDTWAPAGLAHSDGSLYFAGLRGETLYEAKISGESVELVRHLSGVYGRLRAVIANKDALLIGTSNQDGRGQPSAGDDKIFRVPLDLL